MPIDTSFYRQTAPTPVAGPIENLGQALSIKNMIQQQQQHGNAISLQEQQIQAAKRANEENDRITKGHQQFNDIARSVNGDPDKAIAAAKQAGIDYEVIKPIEDHFITQKEKLSKLKTEEFNLQKGKNDLINGVVTQGMRMDDPTFQANWPSIKQQLINNGVKINPEAEAPPHAALPDLAIGFMIDKHQFDREDEARKARKANEEETAAAAKLPGFVAESTSKQQKAEGTEPIQPAEKAKQELQIKRLEAEAQRHLDSMAMQKRGQDITVQGQNMTDARMRELNEATRENKPATSAEQRAFGFYNRAADAEQTLNDLQESMKKKGIVGQAIYKFMPNVLSTEENQIYKQAQRQFTEARLRKDSGATIKDSEYAADAMTYFPQPGDSPRLIDAKNKAREVLLDSLHMESGRAVKAIGHAPGQRPKGGGSVDPNAQALIDKYK